MPVGSYYLLLEAYDLLGRRLYGRTWTGTEITARPLRPPEEIAAEHEALTRRIEALDARLAELSAEQMRLVQEDALADNERKREALLHQRQELTTRLERLPTADAQYRDKHDAFRRRVETETRLITALAEGELAAVIGFQLELPRHVWRGERGFKYYLDLSLAVVPRTMSAKRHDSVLLRTDAFDAWIETISPVVTGDPDLLPAEAMCIRYLRDVVKKGPKEHPKPAYLEEALALIPDLSRRQFNRLWAQEVPQNWKRSGRFKER